jgi:hypothetical protein
MIAELFEKVESPAFSAAVNIASGYRHFMECLEAMPELRELRSQLAQPEHAIKLLARVYELATREVEEEYENRWDVALAAYVLVLRDVSSDLARLAAKKIAVAKNCWWAFQVAETIRPVSMMRATHAKPTQEVGELGWLGAPKKSVQTHDLDIIVVLPQVLLTHSDEGHLQGNYRFFTTVRPAELGVDLTDISSPSSARVFLNLGASQGELQPAESPAFTPVAVYRNQGANRVVRYFAEVQE